MKLKNQILKFYRWIFYGSGALLFFATLSRLIRIYRPRLHPSLSAGIVFEHLACGMFATLFLASATLCWKHMILSTPIKAFLTAMRSALFLSVFNLVWEILQFKGLAWYAAEPGRFQWEQAMVDQLGILVAIMIVTIPIMVFSRYRRLKV